MRRRKFIGLVCAATAWPLAIRAQQPMPGVATIGFLGVAGIASASPAFIEALGKLGYHEGRNLTILHRAAKDSNAELPALAEELVKLKPAVLVAFGTPPVQALKNATAEIPIVMVGLGDPIGTGLIQSLAHPGGNVTGTANAANELRAKRLQLVVQMLPGIRCLAYLRNPSNQSIMAGENTRKSTGEKLGIDFEVVDVATPEQLADVLAAPLSDRCKTALFLPLDGLFISRRSQIAEFALRQKIALFAPFREDAEAGALMAFSSNIDEQWRLGASYVDLILKGAKPADLPVQQPTKFEMVVNLKTAKVLGVEVPTALLLSADKVIE
jgi:putative ABC transport system substrate-binding protein